MYVYICTFIAAPTAVSSWITLIPWCVPSRDFWFTITSISSVLSSTALLIAPRFTLYNKWRVVDNIYLEILKKSVYGNIVCAYQMLLVLKTLNFLIDLNSSRCDLGTWATSSRRSFPSYWIKVPPFTSARVLSVTYCFLDKMGVWNAQAG